MSLSLPMAIQTLWWEPPAGGAIVSGPAARRGGAETRRPPEREVDFEDFDFERGDTVFTLLERSALSAVKLVPAAPEAAL